MKTEKLPQKLKTYNRSRYKTNADNWMSAFVLLVYEVNYLLIKATDLKVSRSILYC